VGSAEEGNEKLLIIPDLPVDIRALTTHMWKVEYDSIPPLALPYHFLLEFCGINVVEHGLLNGGKVVYVGFGLGVSMGAQLTFVVKGGENDWGRTSAKAHPRCRNMLRGH
jgi:hypothetical protein